MLLTISELSSRIMTRFVFSSLIFSWNGNPNFCLHGPQCTNSFAIAIAIALWDLDHCWTVARSSRVIRTTYAINTMRAHRGCKLEDTAPIHFVKMGDHLALEKPRRNVGLESIIYGRVSTQDLSRLKGRSMGMRSQTPKTASGGLGVRLLMGHCPGFGLLQTPC